MSFVQPRPYWTVGRVVKTVLLILAVIYIGIPLLTAAVVLAVSMAVGG